MSTLPEHTTGLTVYSDRPGQWVTCSCGAEWRIPNGTEEFMQKEINETTDKHKAYAKRLETRVD